MNSLKIVSIVLLIIVLVGCQKTSVPIEGKFGNKTVYSLEDGYTVDDLKNHCYEINGVFNTCGSPCADDDDQCIQACAYTCQTFQ
jgi:hypothetical protein